MAKPASNQVIVESARFTAVQAPENPHQFQLGRSTIALVHCDVSQGLRTTPGRYFEKRVLTKLDSANVSHSKPHPAADRNSPSDSGTPGSSRRHRRFRRSSRWTPPPLPASTSEPR